MVAPVGMSPESSSMLSGLRERYLEQGFLLIRRVFGAGKVAEALRIVADVPAWIRNRSNSRNIQRAQPLQTCPVIRDRSWLRTFYDNPALDRMLAGIFGGVIEPAPRMSHDFKLTGLLIEPLDHWWSTGLHRDYRDFIKGLDVAAWSARTGDLGLFNQINIPLLRDNCVWAVPGSHARDDTAAEARLVATRSLYARLAGTGARPERVDRHQEELIGALTACGAVNLRCDPGDLLLYRSNMLHCGIYEPGVERMTLHDGVYSEEWRNYALAVNLSAATARPL